VGSDQLQGRELWLDGFNVLTMVETALGGGVVLIGQDGCCRDVAGVYSRYHKVEETALALKAIGTVLSRLKVTQCVWWLDSPVFNSGRLKATILAAAAEANYPWRVESVTNPDKILSSTDQIVSSSDHEILDRCRRWFNLTREVISQEMPKARVLEFGTVHS
jgi:hypothetical protein